MFSPLRSHWVFTAAYVFGLFLCALVSPIFSANTCPPSPSRSYRLSRSSTRSSPSPRPPQSKQTTAAEKTTYPHAAAYPNTNTRPKTTTINTRTQRSGLYPSPLYAEKRTLCFRVCTQKIYTKIIQGSEDSQVTHVPSPYYDSPLRVLCSASSSANSFCHAASFAAFNCRCFSNRSSSIRAFRSAVSVVIGRSICAT